MTRKRALTVLLLGGIVLLGSCVPLGGALMEALDPPRAAAIVVDPQAGLNERGIEIEADGLARLVYALEVGTTSVQENLEAGEPRYSGRYRIPVRYSVRDGAGNVLVEDRHAVDWRDAASEFSHSVTAEHLALDGGTLDVRFALRKFAAPADGRIVVDAAVGEDVEYGAQVRAMTLEVEHGLHDPTFAIVFGIVLMAVGVVTTVIGFVFVVTEVASAGAGGEGSMPPQAEDADARRIAMACHLCGLAGYVVPFGSLVVPLVVWLVNRRAHPFIDEQGREALNFQLTVLVFSLLCLALALVLIGFLLLILLWIWHIVFTIIGAVRASDGQHFRYPMTIRFLR